MLKGKNIIGVPIVTKDTGETIEKVRDVLFDAKNNRVLGFLVDEEGLLTSAKVIPFEAVEVVGPQAIIVPGASAVVSADQAANAADILNEDNVVVGTKVMTEDGKDLGTINDMFFDEQFGTISGYEVTGGIFADAVSGRSYLPSPQTLRIGRDVAFVPPETANMMENQKGGLAAMTAETEHSMQGAAETMRDTSASVVSAAKGAWETVKEKAADLTDRAKEKTSELTDRATGEIEDRRIKAVLGRPVTRVILDQNDAPILNTGDLITHEAVDRAREAGVLDMLLSSAYTDTPEFSSDELKAKTAEGDGGETEKSRVTPPPHNGQATNQGQQNA